MCVSMRESGVRRGFTLLELVIVIVVLAIIAAIAIPRLSQAGQGASASALQSNLAVLRNAIDLYAAEHAGDFPEVASFEAQMTTYTDVDGDTNATPTAVYEFGPYLRAIPPLPVGSEKGSTGVAASAASGIGWEYTETTGDIRAALPDSETDDAGVQWNAY
jgi:prepilin-type N-terminal cleavage/methylation domain-containing protein